MNENNLFTNPFESLRQGLTRLLRLRKTSHGSGTLGSGILKQADTSPAYAIPQFSTVSLFPDFGASDFDIRQYADRNRGQEHLPVLSSVQRAPSHRTLLPATSLSQFDLRNTFAQQGEVRPHRVRYETVPTNYVSGVSRQASLASLAQPTLHKSTSSLRIRKSKADLRSSIRSSRSNLGDTEPNRKDSQVGSRLRRSTQITSSAAVRSSTHSIRRRSKSPLTSVEHFRSFVVLDTSASAVVTGTSQDLSYIFQKGEEFLLNNQEVEGTSMDIVTGSDSAGNEVTNLLLYSPLVAPSSGRSRFMLVSLVDVSEFVSDAAALPDLDTISEEGTSVTSLPEGVATPPMHSGPGWTTLSHELSVDDLLGGCCLSDGSFRAVPTQDDVWLDLAFSEGKSVDQGRRSSSRGRPQSTAQSSRSSVSSIDDVLADFMTNLQGLYSDFFLLGKSPLDDDCYEICNVSPKVYEAKEYVDGHLSRTPRKTIDSLSERLTQGSSFTVEVNWGSKAEPKQLYCSPLYGQRSISWICFLVDAQMPLLWW